MINFNIINFILIITYATSTGSTEIWKNKMNEYEPDDDCSNFNRHKCLDMKQISEKRSQNYAISETMNKFPNYQSHLHSIASLHCACYVEYQPMYLGDSYYPRYLRNGICKPEKCGGNHRCIEKHYKIEVLKKISENNIDYQDYINIEFPQNLKGTWQPEIKTVTVACECSQ